MKKQHFKKALILFLISIANYSFGQDLSIYWSNSSKSPVRKYIDIHYYDIKGEQVSKKIKFQNLSTNTVFTFYAPDKNNFSAPFDGKEANKSIRLNPKRTKSITVVFHRDLVDIVRKDYIVKYLVFKNREYTRPIGEIFIYIKCDSIAKKGKNYSPDLAKNRYIFIDFLSTSINSKISKKTPEIGSEKSNYCCWILLLCLIIVIGYIATRLLKVNFLSISHKAEKNLEIKSNPEIPKVEIHIGHEEKVKELERTLKLKEEEIETLIKNNVDETYHMEDLIKTQKIELEETILRLKKIEKENELNFLISSLIIKKLNLASKINSLKDLQIELDKYNRIIFIKKWNHKKWREDIASAKTEIVLKELIKFCDDHELSHFSRELINQSARWNSVYAEKRIGSISQDDFSRQINQINQSLIDIIDQIGKL